MNTLLENRFWHKTGTAFVIGGIITGSYLIWPYIRSRLVKEAERIVADVISSRQTLDQVTDLISRVAENDTARGSVKAALIDILRDADTQREAVAFANCCLADPALHEEARVSLVKVCIDGLADSSFHERATTFLLNLLVNPALQSQGADYVWNTFWTSVRPRFMTRNNATNE